MSHSEIITFDREPIGNIEECVANGLCGIESVEEVWVRIVPVSLVGGVWTTSQPFYLRDPDRSILRVYVSFAALDDQGGRHRADRIQEELQVRFTHDPVEFDFRHIRLGDIPEQGTAPRIFKRPPRVWTPGEHRLDLATRGIPRHLDLRTKNRN